MVGISGFPIIDASFNVPDARLFGLLSGLRTSTADLGTTTEVTTDTTTAIAELTSLIESLTTLETNIATQTANLAELQTLKTDLEANVTALNSLRNTELAAISAAQVANTTGTFDTERTNFDTAANAIAITRSELLQDLGLLDTELAAVQDIINGTGGTIYDAAAFFDQLAARGTTVTDPSTLASLDVLLDPTDPTSLTLDAGAFFTNPGILQIDDVAPADAINDDGAVVGGVEDEAPHIAQDAFGTGVDGLGFDGVSARLSIASSTEIDSGSIAAQTIVLALRTGGQDNNVFNPFGTQVIFDAGTSNDGVSIAQRDARIGLFINQGGATVGRARISSIEANKDLVATFIFDGATQTLTARAGGTITETTTGGTIPNTINNTTEDVGIGGIAGSARGLGGFFGITNNEGIDFQGIIGQVTIFNGALTTAEAEGVENFIANKLSIEIADPVTQISDADTILASAIATFQAEIDALDTSIATVESELSAFQEIADNLTGETTTTTTTSVTSTTTTSNYAALALQLQNPHLFGNFGATILRNLLA